MIWRVTYLLRQCLDPLGRHWLCGSWYIYIYIYKYLYIYIYISIYLYLCVYIYICVCTDSNRTSERCGKPLVIPFWESWMTIPQLIGIYIHIYIYVSYLIYIYNFIYMQSTHIYIYYLLTMAYNMVTVVNICKYGTCRKIL